MKLQSWKSRSFSIAASIALLLGILMGTAEAADPQGAEDIIVHLEPGTDANSVATAIGGRVKDRIEGTNVVRITVNDRADRATERARRVRGVGDVERDEKVELVTVQQAEFDFDGDPGSSSSRLAPRYPQQWAAQTLGLEKAHQTAKGQGVLVAVLDTGLDVSHPALAGRISPLQRSFLANDRSVADIGNGIDDDRDGKVDEAVGHGTFVAGLIHLAAPDAQILPLRVLDSDGTGSIFDVARAIRYAVDNGAKVLNLSFGTEKNIKALREAIEYATSRGVTVVASAGNAEPRENPRGITYPARYDSVIAVLATDRADMVWSFSRFGPQVDLGAPGVQLISLYPGGRYAIGAGTSMSAGLTSGAVAVVRSQNPGWTDRQVEQRLESTARPYRAVANNQRNAVGEGIVDLAAAVETRPAPTRPGRGFDRPNR